ncbi:MAG: BREX system ATP-binding domain-containing protein [Chloroflexota bacterium]
MCAMQMRPEDWLNVIRGEYLEDSILGGGAAVKFVVPAGEAERSAVQSGLEAAAAASGYQFAGVDSAITKIHMIDKLFHEVARQIDWDGLALRFVMGLLEGHGYQLRPDRGQLDIREIAAQNQYQESELRRDLRKWLATRIYEEPGMSHEFRIAMLRLCQAQLDPSDVSPAESDAIKEWLCGELRLLSSLKPSLIYQKIARHNARYILYSLVRWLRLSGRAGLLLGLDITQCAADRASTPEGHLYYSKPAAMDAYELLRQLVDGADELSHCLIVVLASPQFLTDPVRGLGSYEALKLRIWDEVRDREVPNPMAALMRLSGSAAPRLPAYLAESREVFHG